MIDVIETVGALVVLAIGFFGVIAGFQWLDWHDAHGWNLREWRRLVSWPIAAVIITVIVCATVAWLGWLYWHADS